VTPMLGIMASQISGHLAPAGSYDSIATTTISTAGTVTFNSIPQTYKHLQLRIMARGTTAAASYNQITIRVGNGSADSGSNYYPYHTVYGNGTTAIADYWGGMGTYLYTATVPTVLTTTQGFGVSVIDILDYTSTNKHKTVKTLYGWDANGTGWAGLVSGLWMPTTKVAIDTMVLSVNATDNFLTNSVIALYGIK